MASSLTASELVAAFENKLAASGLEVDPHADELHMRIYTKEQVAKSFPTLPMQLGGFVIPYFNLAGEKTKFYRFRYLEQPVYSGFAALTAHKQVRYGQPEKTVNEIYLPPLVRWSEIAKNTQRILFITEGELKAACACSRMYPTIGLGGVWCFGAKSKGIRLLSQFNEFEWTGRRVYVVFDSDAASNPDIVAAENVLCDQLVALSAEPFKVRLPNILDLKKTGLDDYLVHHSNKQFDEFLTLNAEPYTGQQELHKLNEEVTYVKVPGIVLKYENKQRMTCDAFTRHAYAHRKMTKIKAKGAHQEVSAAKEWIEWPRRNEVKSITYIPGNSELIVDSRINTWPGWGTEPKKGGVGPWKVLLDNFFKEDKEFRTWFEQWFAYPLQHPGTKLMTAVVVWSRVQGNGKSTVGETMRRIYGNNYAHIDNSQLESSFNEWADSRQFIMGDEITGNDRRAYADRLKNLVTQSEVFVNKKHLPTYTIPDCINYYFTSNHPDVIQLEDCDRRFFIHQVPPHELTVQFFEDYYDWLDKREGAQHLFYHLLTLNLDGFNPVAPAPMTASKQQMQMLTRSDLGSWVATLRDNPDTVLCTGASVDRKSLYTAEELKAFYDPDNKGKSIRQWNQPRAYTRWI
jgi:hypothetical protein